MPEFESNNYVALLCHHIITFDELEIDQMMFDESDKCTMPHFRMYLVACDCGLLYFIELDIIC